MSGNSHISGKKMLFKWVLKGELIEHLLFVLLFAIREGTNCGWFVLFFRK